jgi:hypothetical protein
MALIIALNTALSLGVTLMVVAPLTWAILAEHPGIHGVLAHCRRRRSIQTTRPSLA